jgi:enoyl-CoA hydratase
VVSGASTLRSYADLPESLSVAVEGPVRVLTLNRPDKLNAIDGQMHHAFAGVWQLFEGDDDARSILIRAEGDTFCAGGDYSWFKSQQEDPEEQELALLDGHRILDRMLACRLPVVTAIQGAAVGLGASVGILSDLVVMSDDAFYRDTHVALGMTAGDGGVAWPMSVGMQIAKQYVLLGDRLPAAEAHRLGMVNAVVPKADLDGAARTFAERLAGLPRVSAQSTKRAFNLQYENQLRPIAEFALAWERLSLADPEFVAKVRGL